MGTRTNKPNVSTDSVNIFNVERWNQQHIVYLSKMVYKLLSKSDNLRDNLKDLDKDAKLSENDKRFIIFSVGVNIGEELKRQDSQSLDHYR